MESASWVATALSMLVAISALVVSLWSARRQAADAQKAAIMRLVAEFIVKVPHGRLPGCPAGRGGGFPQAHLRRLNRPTGRCSFPPRTPG
ncbi:hypothetical protein [Streptomyces sp. AN091965]|uniref:hypothetical protein n=1 Tax=Streptomyces sp. AN091965 TaxID=2927803 RepID=UPI001F61DE06|nr:hypothetical protein [Streptomyces sp. AN091965]MCI3928310.1 hypothetical protein [Streptomyces sp. AN091965]